MRSIVVLFVVFGLLLTACGDGDEGAEVLETATAPTDTTAPETTAASITTEASKAFHSE